MQLGPHPGARVHSVNRRWAVAPDGPNDAAGSCCHVHPDVTTNTIAANTSRSPYRRRPPPCGRDGASGTTRWNSSHSSSGTSRSTIPTTCRAYDLFEQSASVQVAWRSRQTMVSVPSQQAIS